jgi:hypothetical protein
MSEFAPVSPPAWGKTAKTPQATVASIEMWLGNDPLDALVRKFGGRIPECSTAERLEWLEDFSAKHWDFRAGQERNLAARTDFDEATTSLILDTAAALGLTATTLPQRDSYSHVLILGGLVRACLLRPRYTAELVRGGLKTGSIAALSAYRPLAGDEDDLIEALGLSGKSNEMEAMEAGLAAAFDLREPADERRHDAPDSVFGTSLVRTWHSSGVPVQLVIAPSPEPTVRRANTADTYSYWADSCARIDPNDNLLLVTSSIYLPYQHADAVRMLALPHHCSVETVGISFSEERFGVLRQSFTATNYLQEIRSAIRSVRSLYLTATAMLDASSGK